MTKQISWTYNVEVVGGSRISESKTISAEAVDEIGLTIDPQQTKEIEIQPGGAGQVQFLLIKSDRYGDQANQVTYKVNATNQPVRTLDGPHLLIGKGATGLLVSTTAGPNKLFVTNGLANDPISISILVGRDATP
jgi:hypothetical protein